MTGARGVRRSQRTKDTHSTPISHDYPSNSRQFSLTSNPRDSDVTYNSSRPSSSSSIGRISTVPTNDRAYQSTLLRFINEYLSTHNCNFSLKPPLPSARDITETIKFLIHRLDWSPTSLKLDEDLPILLKYLNCPFKLNKSALKAPGTPHAWPSLLQVIYWLAQNACYCDHISSAASFNTTTATTRTFLKENKVLGYALDSYSHYIAGKDHAVENLDREFSKEMEVEIRGALDNVESMEKHAEELEAEIEAKRSAPSSREALEKDKSILEGDVVKFYDIIDTYKSRVDEAEKECERKEKELAIKLQENQMICQENEELKKKADSQKVNQRDAERMKRELMALERDIADAETARNAWEEKSWDLVATTGKQFKEMENLSIECNQAIKRLKLRNDFQYMLNTKGSKAADVLGIDYKSTLKPAFHAFEGDLKKSSMEKLEELISLQQQSQDNDSKLKARKSRLEDLQSRIDAVESHSSSVKKEIQDLTSRCATEAKRMVEELEIETHKVNSMEREADDFLKISNAKLQEVIMQSNEETQICARELLMLVDSVSKYKEKTESTVLEMKRELSETASSVANAYKEWFTSRVENESTIS